MTTCHIGSNEFTVLCRLRDDERSRFENGQKVKLVKAHARVHRRAWNTKLKRVHHGTCMIPYDTSELRAGKGVEPKRSDCGVSHMAWENCQDFGPSPHRPLTDSTDEYCTGVY